MDHRFRFKVPLSKAWIRCCFFFTFLRANRFDVSTQYISRHVCCVVSLSPVAWMMRRFREILSNIERRHVWSLAKDQVDGDGLAQQIDCLLTK